MFERYTEKARRVIFFARFEASSFGASQIEAEYILLGLLREDRKVVTRFFNQPHVSIETIRKEVEKCLVIHPPTSSNIDLPLSPEAKRVLSFAAEESEKLNHRHIGTEHLLLGLLHDEKAIAAEILSRYGLQLSEIRQALLNNSRTDQPVTRKFSPDEVPSAGSDEMWMCKVVEACIGKGLFTQEDLVSESGNVAALRQLPPDAEALLRLLAAKRLAEPQNLPALALELRDEKKLAEFIERLKQR
jgi:ATP-dependent Clp protease ATP-binding subunit ClpA